METIRIFTLTVVFPGNPCDANTGKVIDVLPGSVLSNVKPGEQRVMMPFMSLEGLAKAVDAIKALDIPDLRIIRNAIPAGL